MFPPTHRSVVRTPCFGIQVHWPGKCFAPSPALLCYHALLHILLRIYFSFMVASSTSQSRVFLSHLPLFRSRPSASRVICKHAAVTRANIWLWSLKISWAQVGISFLCWIKIDARCPAVLLSPICILSLILLSHLFATQS